MRVDSKITNIIFEIDEAIYKYYNGLLLTNVVNYFCIYVMIVRPDLQIKQAIYDQNKI